MSFAHVQMAAAPFDAPQRVKLRSYQTEMLETSLQKNVIVAMDTGSGKTHIAVARIQVELERNDKVGLPYGSPCVFTRRACTAGISNICDLAHMVPHTIKDTC